MKARAPVAKKAVSSPAKAVASKASQSRPFAAKQITPNLQAAGMGASQGSLLGGVQVTPRAMIQTKLTIGAPGDKYEREADRMAEAVMNAPTSTQNSAGPTAAPAEPISSSITPVTSGQNAPAPATGDANLSSQLSLSNSGGNPLPSEVRSFMEPRFGVDLSSVRVHTDSAAGQMNQQLNAKAFTYGNHIYFGPGQSPTNHSLTAHELTHVMQQTGIGAAPSQGQSAKAAPASAPAPRVQRNSDYSSGLGGPVAA